MFRVSLGLGLLRTGACKITCAFVENGEQLFSVRIRAFAVHPESDERAHADVQPEPPAAQPSLLRI